MRTPTTALACLCAFLAAACGPDIRREFAPRGTYAPLAEKIAPESVLLQEGDLSRPYAVLGEITVSADSSPKNPPDRALRRALAEKAASVGADAVIELKTEVVLAGTPAYSANRYRDVWGQTYAGQKTTAPHDRTVLGGLAVRFPR